MTPKAGHSCRARYRLIIGQASVEAVINFFSSRWNTRAEVSQRYRFFRHGYRQETRWLKVNQLLRPMRSPLRLPDRWRRTVRA